MTEHSGNRRPTRQHHNQVVYTSIRERPEPTYTLDRLHKVLLVGSAIVAVVLLVYFVIRAWGMDGSLPMQYGIDGQVRREGSVWEGIGTLTMLGATTVGVAVLARYPRIFNFPFVLTEDNVQRQYKNAVQMLAWLALSCALIMVVMVGSWVGVLSIHWTWLSMAIMIVSLIFFMSRMFKLR